MPPLIDDEDRQMGGRVRRAFRNPENREWAQAYFDSGTHAAHSDPAERRRHEKHVEAVQWLQDELQREAAARQYRATLHGSAGSRQQIEIEINKLRSGPDYMDAKHRDHQNTMDRISYLYRELHKGG